MKLDAAKAHMQYLTLHIFRSPSDYGLKDKKTIEIMDDLYRVYAIRLLIDDCGALYESGFFMKSAHSNLLKSFDVLVARIRPFLVPLVESHIWPKNGLATNIGNYYGDIEQL